MQSASSEWKIRLPTVAAVPHLIGRLMSYATGGSGDTVERERG